jgi:hypothetical protein
LCHSWNIEESDALISRSRAPAQVLQLTMNGKQLPISEVLRPNGSNR